MPITIEKAAETPGADRSVGDTIKREINLTPEQFAGSGFEKAGFKIVNSGNNTTAPQPSQTSTQPKAPEVKPTQTSPTPQQPTGGATGSDMYSQAQTQLDALNAQNQAQINQVLSQFDNIQKQADQQNAELIESIKQTYAARIEDMKLVNQANLGVQTIGGYRTGRARYASELQNQVLSNEERQGVKRIADLERERAETILQAERAATERDFEALGERMNYLTQANEQQRRNILDQLDLAQQQDEAIMARAKFQQEQKAALFEDLSLMVDVGQEISDDQKQYYDQTLGFGDGFTDSYLKATEAMKQAEQEQAQFDSDMAINEFLLKVPEGTPVKLGNAIYEGMKLGDIKFVQETDEFGNVTVVKYDDRGNIIGTDVMENIGKPMETEMERALATAQLDKLQKELSGEILSEADSDALIQLRSKFSAEADVKNFQDVRNAYQRIESVGQNGTPASDLALIFNYMKMLDPNSVVRESEFKTAEQARGWLSRAEEGGVSVPAFVKQGIQKMEGKGTLLPEQRKDFLLQAQNLYQPAEDNYTSIVEQYKSFARDMGLPEDKAVMDYLSKSGKYENLPKLESSYNSLDKLLQDNPEYDGFIGELFEKYPDKSDQDILEGIYQLQGMGFNKSLGMDTKGQKNLQKIAEYPTGAKGGQCGVFAHKVADFPPVGNTLKEKKNTVLSKGLSSGMWRKQGARIGDVLITTENPTWGHVAVVNKVLPNGKLQLTESNYNGDERVTHTRIMDINNNKIFGTFRG